MIDLTIIIMFTILLITGAVVGLVSSFFGVGGSFITVPVTIYIFETFMGVSPGLATLIAFGTNMPIVVLTSFSGVHRHRKELKIKNMKFPVRHYLSFGIPVGIGSFIGALLVFTFFTSFRAESGIVLEIIFGLFCFFGAYRLMKAKPITVKELTAPPVSKYAASGLFSGIFAHFIGSGGGIVYVPVLNTLLGVPALLAVGISLATMVIGSSIGTLSFGLLGHIDQMQHAIDYPPLTFGWLNLTAFLGIGVASVLLAQVGPRLAYRTSPKKFEVLLAIIYFFIGFRLIIRGIYQLQGLVPPIL
ncbi:MAG: sulfite exporter TauE/SafE family protein [Candidatus Methylarchaceae archaeon HK01B]|nr:sulfite exporter TauE/SafE family protein [Candidatus Methylarchaceae archaeon HK02M1]MCP8319136.1 sulfite exporter TauE/SafE family protein [Candidatus Methylarchaceae archaeon HK01B]